MALYFVIAETVRASGILSFLANNYLLLSIFCFIFANLLVNKFNKEYTELELSKHHLEEGEEKLRSEKEKLRIEKEEKEQLNQKLQELIKQLEEYKSNLELKVNERTKELENAKNEIELKEKQKTSFFINLAHETKTPLTLIENYLDKYIKDNGLSLELNIMQVNINKLKTDIINFFDIEKSEKGNLLYDHDNIIDLVQVLTDKIPLLQECAHKKEIEFKYENTLVKACIKINSSAIDRIINNIFDNSLKYTENWGQIIIKLSADAGNYILSISDTGIGISEDQQPYIFEPYYQASHEKKQYQGIGVGLSIVKRIIDEVNGKIEVKSQTGKGTEIKIQFHKYELKEGENIISPAKNRNDLKPVIKMKFKDVIYDDHKKSVLLVEDNLVLLAGIQDELCRSYNCYYAVNGKDALTKLAEIPKPDIIISDIMMDIMDGYEFYDILKSNPDFKNIPFIFLTAKTAQNEKIKGLKKGAVDYILKPVNFEELSVKLCSLLNIYEALKEENLKIVEKKLTHLIDKQIIKGEKDEQEHHTDLQKLPLNKKYLLYKIARREIEIISLIKKGFEYKAIADILKISDHTVETYRSRIFKKCNIANKAELLQIFSE